MTEPTIARVRLAAVLHRCREAGPVGSVREIGRLSGLLADRAALEALRLLFGFASWHAASPDSARPYRKQLAALVNGLEPVCAVEVGCGLGGIISRVNARRRYGLDVDVAVIRAARILHGRSVRFIAGGFDQVPDEKIDVLIAVNWLQAFSPEQVERWINVHLPKVRYLLVDAVMPGTAGYRFYHDFAFLNGRGTRHSIPAAGEAHREFLLWKIAS